MAFHWRRYPHHRFENRKPIGSRVLSVFCPVQRGHDLLEQLEGGIRAAIPGAQLFSDLEPQGDLAAWEDIALDRKDSAAGSKNN